MVPAAQHTASVALVTAGTVVTVASAIGAFFAPDTFARLHFTTPITSLGGPLIAIGLAVENGPNLVTASILFPMFLLFVASPVMTSAIARMAAQRRGLIDSEDPG
jgi:monovalent cation/proton antiporter MnhG/PhaG subunit